MREETSNFETFFKENFQKFYIYALHILNDEEACRDIVADVMEYACRNYGKQDDRHWFNYSISSIRNKCLDHIRRKAVHKKYVEFYTHIVEHKETMEPREEDERIADIMKVMRQLNPKTRLVFQECYINRKTYKEVAEELDISPDGVKKHIIKALKTIREEIHKKYKKQ
ncbi:MAG: sigma-70 family RNA polymerase sigma factor [Prevotella sp.]